MTHISRKLLVEIIKSNYSIEIPQESTLTVKQIREGYMNNCLQITITASQGLNSETQDYIGIFYNTNRYTDPASQKRLGQAYLAAEFLKKNNIPARTPVYSSSNKHIIKVSHPKESRELLFALYHYLPGKTLNWEAYTRRHLRSLGQEMAKIHKVWKEYNSNTNELEEWNDYLQRDHKKLINYTKKNQTTIAKKLGIRLSFSKVKNIIEKIHFNSKTNQLIHYDFVRGNILFADKKEKSTYPITGILDFEKTMLAPTVVDLARTLAFLLVDCKFKTDEQVYMYFLEQGYFSLQSKENVCIDALSDLVVYFWLRDFWKFLTGNPYQSLVDNYHYQETAARLNDSGVINSD